jgi:CRP-like cAMP-binding protein
MLPPGTQGSTVVASPSYAQPDALPLIAKLESIFPLTDEEKGALLNLPMQVQDIRADQDIVREGDRPSRSCLLIEGLACTYKITGEGRRQIMAFHLAGDIPDLQSLHLDVLDNSLGSITPCRVAFIQHEALHDLCARHPRIVAALWRETLIDASIFREWVLNVGRREAPSRMAHLFCEMVLRMRAVGLAQEHVCDLPLTQTELGDALGLSTVHVNRTLQELRGAGLVSWTGTTLTVLDWQALQQVGDFDATYLHLHLHLHLQSRRAV